MFGGKVGGTVETTFKFNTEGVKDLEKVKSLMKDLEGHKKSGRMDYFTGLETALAHIKQSYKEMADAEKKTGVSDDKKTGTLVRWVNAYKALGGTMEDVSQAIPNVDIEKIVSSFMEKKGDSYKKYSVEKFSETFSILKELGQEVPNIDLSEYSKTFNETAEQVEKAADRILKAVSKIKKEKPQAPEIKAKDIFDSDEIQQRIQDVKKQFSDLSSGIAERKARTPYDPALGEFGAKNWVEANYSQKQIREIFQSFFELEKYYDEIGEDVGQELRKQYASISGLLGISKAQEDSFISKGQSAAKKKIKNVRTGLVSGVAPEGQPTSSVSTPKQVEEVGEAAEQAGQAAQNMGESGQQAGQKMAKGVEGAVSKLQELKSQLDEAKKSLGELEEQQATTKKQFDDKQLVKEKLDVWRKYGKTSENPEEWLVAQIDKHVKEGKIETAAIYRNILRTNYKENNTPFFDEDGQQIKFAPIMKGLLSAYKSDVSIEDLNDINARIRAQRELVASIQERVEAEEKLERQRQRAPKPNSQPQSVPKEKPEEKPEATQKSADEIERDVNRIKEAISLSDVDTPETLTKIQSFITQMVEEYKSGAVGVEDAVQRIKDKLAELKEIPSEQKSTEYISKSDDEIYESAMKLAENRETVLKDIAQREMDLANKTSGETKKIYQQMAQSTFGLFKDNRQDGDYKIDEKLQQVKQHVQDLQEQISHETNPEILSSLNEQLDEAKIKLIALSEVFKTSSDKVGVYASDALSFGSEAIDRYERKQRENYQIGDSNFSIAKSDREYWDTLTQGIKTEDELTDAINRRKEALVELEEKRRVAEERTLSLDRNTPEYQEAFKNEMDITEQYNEARLALYNLLQLQRNWGKSLQEASQIDISFLSHEWRQEEQAFIEIDNIINKLIEDKKKLNDPTSTGQTGEQTKSSVDIISQTLEKRKQLTGNKSSPIFAHRLEEIRPILEQNEELAVQFYEAVQKAENVEGLSKLVKIVQQIQNGYYNASEAVNLFNNALTASPEVSPEIEAEEQHKKRMIRLNEINQMSMIFNKLGTDQTTGRNLFDWIIENGTYAQKKLFEVEQGFERFQAILHGMSVNHEGLFHYTSTHDLDLARLKYIEKAPEGWKKIEGAQTAPKGFQWYSNGASRFSDEYRIVLVKISETTEAEEKLGQTGQTAGQQISQGIDQAINSVNKYREVLNKSFETSGKRSATEQLKNAYMEYQKYFGEGGQDTDKIVREMSDEGRIAAYNYYEAFKEAMQRGIAKSNLEKYMIEGISLDPEDIEYAEKGIKEYIQEQARILEELGNPKLSGKGLQLLDQYMKQWDLIESRKSGFYDDDKDLLQADLAILEVMKSSLREYAQLLQDTQGQTKPSSSLLDFSQVTNIDQLSEYINQIDIAKASAEELQSILSKANELGGLSSLPSEQVQQLTDRMRELGIVAGQTAGLQEQQAGAAEHSATADQQAAEAAGAAADADERAADANEKKANTDAQGASAASASAEGDMTGAHGASGEVQAFTELEGKVSAVKQLIADKNELIKQEVDYVSQNLSGETGAFSDLAGALDSIKGKLDEIIGILPEVKFDFVSPESKNKITTLSSDIASLNSNLDNLDGKDVFKNLNNLLNPSDITLGNNLQAIINKFKDLKEVMNGFNNNGTAVFKGLSDVANAGDQLVSKMQKLFQESGIKINPDKTTAKAEAFLSQKESEIRSSAEQFLTAQPGNMEAVVTEMRASGNGIVEVIAKVKQALQDGQIAFKEYKLAVSEAGSGISVSQTSVKNDDKAFSAEIAKQKKEAADLEKQIEGAFKKVEEAKSNYIKEYATSLSNPGSNQNELAYALSSYFEQYDALRDMIDKAGHFQLLNGDYFFDEDKILKWVSMFEKINIEDDEQSAISKQRAKDIEELSETYSKLAEARQKAEESKKKTGKEDPAYTKQINDLLQRQIELYEKLGFLSSKEKEQILKGQMRANEIRQGNKKNDDLNSEFASAKEGYQTLIDNMERYYRIIEKMSLGKKLTLGDISFLEKYKIYFEQAGRAAEGASKDIGIFADQSEEASKAQENFLQKRAQLETDFVKNRILGLKEQIGNLESPEGKPPIYNKDLTQLKGELKQLDELAKNFKVGDEEQLQAIIKKIQDLSIKTQELGTNTEKYQFADPTKVAKLDRQMADWNVRNSNAGAQYAEQINAYRDSLKEGLTGEEFNAVIQGFERTKAAAADAGSVGASFVDGLKQRIRSLGQYLLSFASFYRVIGVFRKAFTIVKDLDTAMTEMRKVSEESVETLSRYQFESFDMADKVGTTAKQIQDSTADWLRLGRTFEQSKTLAEQSTVLLNVSEFENINDATQALVSATQAYDELDAQTIIDKLNLIGNNFAVSTSDLAQGLQNAAAVLKTQGNDIDQSLALLTAGNLIGQDISKASMGIRTISLRISGTEEAKDEVKDMGEDIDDFVVRTKSKTDQIIRDYTAVASNAYKGVSVLDANGNLRDTYDILLDISKIYKEIQDEDKKNGTNRAQALVETLAGKTRSNIAASILLNGDVLEDVYNASANDYEGSAQRENEKYLDSIEGRVARLQNRLQELAFTSFAANDIKPIITFLTDAVGLATTLVDKIGLLPALIGSIGGAVLQYSGLGLFGKNGGTGFSGIIPALKQNKFFRQFGELKLNNVQSEFFNSDKFLNRDGAKSLININEALSGSYGELTARQESYFLGLQNQGVKMVGVVEAQNALSDATFTFGSVMKGVSNIAAGFVSTLATMGVTMLAAFAMQAVIKGISDFVHHSENLINAGEEAKSTMSSVKQSMEETKESISGLSDEYAKLSTGVTVNGSTVKNLNLSEEEFTRYIELSNQIAQIAPELVTGYDNQGNAIVNLGNTIDDVNGKFEEYIRIQETIANGEYGKNLDSMWEGAEEQASKYRIEIGNLESQLRDIVPQTVDGKTDAPITRQTKSFSFQTDAKVQAKIEEALAQAGVLYNQPYLDVPSGLTTFNFDPDELAKLSDKQLQEINAAVSQTSYFNKADRQIIQAQQAKARLLLEKAYSDQIPYIQDYVRTNGLFDLIDDQDYAEGLENSLVNMLANVDYPSISSDVASKGGLRAWLDEFMASFLIDDTELRDALSEFFDLQEKRATMTYKEYADQRNQLFDTIAEKTGYDFYDLAVFFGEATQDEEGIHWKTKDRITSAAEKLNVESLGYSRDDFSKELQKYDSEYSDAALSAIENIPQGKVSSIARSWESVWEYLEPYLTGKAVIKQEDPTDTLSQVFNADGFDVSNYTSKLSAVETALSSLYENGFLSDQEKVTLQDALPDLSDFDAESIKKAGGDVLKEYIKYIRDEASKFDLTEDAQRDLDTYVANLAKSYTSSVSAQSWGEILNDSVYSSLTGQNAASRYSGIVSALGDRLQDSDAATIMLMLDADSTLANGSIEEIVDKWDEYKIQLGITLNDEEEARIKRELQHIETAQGLNDARISSAEANGGRASKGQRQQAYDLARAATREAEKYTQTQLDDYQRALGSGDEGYIRSIWDLVLQSRTDEEQKRQAETEALKELLMSDANNLLEEEERLETEADALQTQREREEKFDGQVSDETIDAIKANNEERQKNADALADFFTNLAESDEGAQFSEEFLKTAQEYMSKALGFESDAFDTSMIRHQNALENLSEELARVQASAQATSDALSLAEAQGRETTAADYQRQIDDAEDQIAVLIKQRREQLAIQRDLQGQEGTQAYKDAQAEVENLTSQIRQLQVEQVNAQKAMGEIPMLHLQADQTSLEEASQSLQDELSDPRNAPTVDVYVNLIANADDQISNLEQQRAELQRKMAEAESRQGFSVYDTDYVEYRSRLAEVDSQIQQVTQSQLEWRKAILEMPLDKINQQLEEYADKLSRISAARELSEASGRATTEKDYLAEAQAYEGEASLHHRASILRGLEAARLVSNGYSIDSEEVRAVMSQRNQEYTAWMSSRTSALQSRRTADELNLGRIQDQIGLLEQSASQLNDAISLAEASGQTITAMDYQRLVGNADVQIAKNEELISEYESLMAKWTPEQGSEIWKTYVEGIDNATSQITQLRQSQVEWHDTMMQLGLTDLQNEQADLERQITVAEQEHHKVSEKTYRDLIKNGERQIKNLRAQQRGLDKMGPKYREIQSQIDQVSDSMREWENTADHLAAVAGQNLSSAISSAMSEINSETGLTRETMDSLLQSFDDLTAYDLSGLFYESADGMKLNVGMAQDLIDAQYELTMSGYEKTIAEQNKIIAENTGLQDENAQAALAAAQRRKLAAEQDMAMYQAQYNAQRDALSPFQAWQNATQTKNAGANYETYQGAWEGIKEAYEKGWTNTDDFKTYVAFFDRWGRGTLQAYEDEKEVIKRYITEDDSGVFNFMDDLVAKGLGRMDEDGHYLIDTTSFEEMGEATNMSADAAEMMFGRAKDRGFITYAARTVQEAQLDMVDTTHSLIEETSRYQQMLADGASTEQLEEQRQVIDDLRYTMIGYKDVIGDLSQSYGKITSTDLQTSISQIEALRELMTDEELTSGLSDGELAKYQEGILEEIQRIADETGIPLKVNAEGEIDMDKLQEQFDGFTPKVTVGEVDFSKVQTTAEQMEELQKGGNVDLLSRPLVDAAELVKEGWEEAGEGIATVYTNTYSNVKGTKAANFTPIQVDAEGNIEKILSPKDLQEYAENVIDGGEDYLNLQIGATFTGQDAIQQAEESAQQIHQLQDDYYLSGVDPNAEQKFIQNIQGRQDEIQGYVNQLEELELSQEQIQQLSEIDFDDGEYITGLEDAEDILDNMAKALGLNADEAESLLPLLERFGLINWGGEKTWTKPVSSIMGTEVGALDSWIRENENAEVDLNFDPTEMSVDELGEKIKEISKLKVQIDADPEAGDEVKTQYRQLMHSLTQQYGMQKKVDRMYQMTGLTADDFLALDEEGRKQVMVDIGVNPEDYDSFIESAQNQSIAVKIEGALKDGHTIEELLNMKDEDLANALDISMDEESIAAAREMLENISMEPYKTAGQTIADQIEDKSSSIGSKIGTGFIEAVTGFIDLLTGGDEETSTTSYNTLPKTTADTTSYQPDDNHAPLPQAGQGSTIVDKHVTELSVEGAHESEAEVADYTKAIEEIPESKKTTITTTKNEINRTTSENNVVSNYKMSSSDLMNNDINKKTQESGGTINVSVNVQGKEQVDALKQSIDDIEGKNVDVRASVYGIGTVSTLNNEISKVTGKDVSVNASVNGFALVSGLVSKMNELQDKKVTITTEHKTVMTRGEQYTGSVTGTPYTAHASGTAYNMLNLTPKTEANAAGNDVSIQKTGKSLVNELGQESLIIPKFICLKRDLVTLYSNVH